MSPAKIISFIIIPLFLIIILAVDYYLIEVGGTEASISSFIISISYKMPMIPFGIGAFLGFFCGHLFWRMKSNKDTLPFDKGLLK